MQKIEEFWEKYETIIISLIMVSVSIGMALIIAQIGLKGFVLGIWNGKG